MHVLYYLYNSKNINKIKEKWEIFVDVIITIKKAYKKDIQ